MYDTHIHTNNSPDSKQSIDTVCTTAIEKGLSAITISDHAEVSLFHLFDFHKLIKGSINDVQMAQKKYGNKIKILQGIEISEFFWDEEKLKGFLSLADYDIILGSVHRVDCIEHTDTYSHVVMSDTSEENLHIFLKIYFDDMVRMTENYDFDILTHLTVPLRYVNGKYGRGIDISRYDDTIRKILRMVIDKGIALEVNTSGLDTPIDCTFPDDKYIRWYKEMGGELVTIASDAHSSDRVGYGFDRAKKMLKEIGFDGYYYYEKRKPVKVKIKKSQC